MPVDMFDRMGYSGFSGYSGKSGFSGYSGISGFSGYSGISGFSGKSGYSGISGYSGAGNSGTIRIIQPGHGFVVGDIVRLDDPTDLYVKALADSAEHAEVAGMVVNVIDASTFDLIVAPGQVTGLPGTLNIGEVYFLSPTSAGTLTGTEPTTIGQISKPLLIATGTTAGLWLNWRGVELVTASTGISGYSGYSGTSGYSGYSGLFGGDSHRYQFSTLTDNSDPGSGHIAFNNATLSSATQFTINQVNGDGVNISAWTEAMDDTVGSPQGTMRIFKLGNSSIFADFNVVFTGLGIIPPSGTSSFSLAYVTGNGSFANNDSLVVTYVRWGSSGYSGISGYSGYSGKSGFSGYSGGSTSGFSGYSGPSGFSGYSGPSGFSGYSGISGYSGYSGKSGFSGYSGIGTSGFSGYSGPGDMILASTQRNTGAKTFANATIKIENPAATFSYIVTPAAISADRILNLPNMTSTDTMTVNGLAQTLQNKTFTGTFFINCGLKMKVTDVTGNYSATATDTFLSVSDTSSAWNIALPIAVTGTCLIIKDTSGAASTHNITITPSAPFGETVEGSATIAITTNYGYYRLFAIAGIGWFYW